MNRKTSSLSNKYIKQRKMIANGTPVNEDCERFSINFFISYQKRKKDSSLHTI